MKNQLVKLRVSLGHGLFALLLGCFSYQAIALEQECSFYFFRNHPIEKCANVFSQELASIKQERVARYEEEFQQIKAQHGYRIYGDLLYLTMFYPKPEVLFETFQRFEENCKYAYGNSDDKIVFNEYLKDERAHNEIVYNEYIGSHLTKYYQSVMGYRIIAKMLENQTSLSDNEKEMLAISKQREVCIGEGLQYFEDNRDLPISIHYISDKCFP